MSARGFIAALARDRPLRLAWLVTAQVLAGLGQAACLLLLIPVLGQLGVHTSHGVSNAVWDVLGTFGLHPSLTTALVAYVVASTAVAALTAYQSVLAVRYRLEFVDGLRSRLYRAVALAPWSKVMTRKTSDLLTILASNTTLVAVAVLGALAVAVAAITIVAQLAVALTIAPALTGVAAASGAALVAVVWPLVRESRRLGAELLDRNRVVVGRISDMLAALKLAKAFGRQRHHADAFDDALRDARAPQVAFARASGMATAVQATLTAVLLALTVEVAVRALAVPVGSLMVVALVFSRVVGQITAAQAGIQQLAQGLPAFEEITALTARLQRIQEPEPAGRIAIGAGVRLDDVHFAYAGADVLRGISLVVPAGAMVALVGPSGAGKTTVADLVAGLLAPSRGRVLVDGEPLTGDDLPRWRASVALVPQDPFLFGDTIRANLEWARPGATESEMREALRLAALGPFVDALPAGLDTVVGDRGMSLSGGERQRVALARALVRGADLLVLDEATSSLDAVNAAAIREAVRGLRGRQTILLIAHGSPLVDDADQVVTLEDGRVAAVTLAADAT